MPSLLLTIRLFAAAVLIVALSAWAAPNLSSPESWLIFKGFCVLLVLVPAVRAWSDPDDLRLSLVTSLAVVGLIYLGVALKF